MKRAYLFDTETTDRKDGEIIEAGLAAFSAYEDLAGVSDRIVIDVVPNFSCVRYMPSKQITTGALAVHHILPSELDGCSPSRDFSLPDDCEYIVGHSIDFDWEVAGRPDVKRICTHAIAKWVYPDATGYSLVALIYQIFGANDATRGLVRGAHSASHDCYLAYLLLRDILVRRPEIDTWSQLYAFSDECRIPRTCPMKKYEGVPLEELDEGFIGWCLRQEWLDDYFRKGLSRVLTKRYERGVI